MPEDAHEIDVIVECDKWKKVRGLERLAADMIVAAINYTGYAASKGYKFQVNVLLEDDAAVRELNYDFRGKDKPTNILSFPAYDGDLEDYLDEARGEDGLPLGDMILGFGTIEKEAQEQGKDLSDHTAHLILHGTLHLLGFDHENDDEAAMMEDVEIRILRDYHIANPYQV